MINETDKSQLEKTWLVTRLIWSALFASLIVYLIIGVVLEGKMPPAADLPLGPLKAILFGIAIAIFVATYFVRKLMIGKRDDGPSSMAERSQTDQSPGAGRYITAIVISASMSESIGICGLVYFFLSQDLQSLYLFIGTSAIAMFTYRPRREEFEEAVGARRNG